VLGAIHAMTQYHIPEDYVTHCVGSHSCNDTVPYPRRLWSSHPHQHNCRNLKPCKL